MTMTARRVGFEIFADNAAPIVTTGLAQFMQFTGVSIWEGGITVSLMAMELTVTYDDGTVAEVTAGQREIADWEGQPFGCASTSAMDVTPMMFVRFLAWSALRRQGERRSFAVWSDVVDEVTPHDDEDPS